MSRVTPKPHSIQDSANSAQHFSSNCVTRPPRQRGRPANDLGLIPNHQLEQFMRLRSIDIKRMLRKRRLRENGTKVSLWLRLHEDIRLEKHLIQRQNEDYAACAATQAAIEAEEVDEKYGRIAPGHSDDVGDTFKEPIIIPSGDAGAVLGITQPCSATVHNRRKSNQS